VSWGGRRSVRAQLPEERAGLLGRALLLVSLSGLFGLISGAASVTLGLTQHSLGVLAAGLAVLADVSGSAVLVWRFRAERDRPHHGLHVERRAALVIVTALAVMSATLTFESIQALLAGTHPGSSPATLLLATATVVVLLPLAYLKRGTATALASDALRGDSTLSAIGAASAGLALLGLLLFRTLGWWWPDRVAALLIAAVAAIEGVSIARER
jgi:divalent metal cation (Fe/Co/Zn/Cd) transporter